MSLFQAEDITASYLRAGVRTTLLSGASFSLEAGGVYDLVGPSGSGKSTLLRVCARMLARDGGELFLDGAPSSSFEPVQWRRRVCLVPQQPALVGGTVRDNLLLPWTLSVNAGSAPPADGDLERLLEAADLHDVELGRNAAPPADGDLERLLEAADLHDVELGRNAAQLSGGQAARVALLRAFATRPRVLLLDEVDAALDDESARAVGRLTKSRVDDRMACLRIRHRAADGVACGTFSLRDGALSYASRADADGEGTRS